MGNGVTQCEWCHAPEARRIWGIWSKWVELRLDTERDGWLSLAREGLGQVSHEMGGCRWKGRNRKIAPLSPYVEKPLNSKVIKSFAPAKRSRKCFSCFEIPMFYVIYIYIYIYEHYMSISHIAVFGYGTERERERERETDRQRERQRKKLEREN